jgi:membrane-bound lytic murein transglycosylase D
MIIGYSLLPHIMLVKVVFQEQLKRIKLKSLPTDFWNLELSSQTSAYVPRLLALIEIIKSTQKNIISNPNHQNDQYFSIIKIDNQIDLALAAELAEMDLNELYLLNAGFNRWATSPNGPHRLLIPNENAITFSEAYELLPANQRLRWKRHQVTYGETLSEIAEQYNTTAKQIKISNDMNSNVIRADKFLMIPVAYNNLESYKNTSDQRLISKQNKQRGGERIEHIIKRGESLWLIARRYDVKINTLASWNNMSPKDMLSIGDKLVLWAKQPPINNKPIQRKLNYSVKNGDSLYLIAKKFRVSIAGLARWNNLDQQKNIKTKPKINYLY